MLGIYDYLNRLINFIFTKNKKIINKKNDSVTDDGKYSEPNEGDIVEVLSAKEIFETLDRDGKLEGLRFTQEMGKYCGKQFKIIKKINKIIIETTGELRSIKKPTFILEGVVCDGKQHGECDRLCFCYWRRSWLKPINTVKSNSREKNIKK